MPRLSELTTRELHAVIAGLRMVQVYADNDRSREGWSDAGRLTQLSAAYDLALDSHGDGLDPAELDALVERINR